MVNSLAYIVLLLFMTCTGILYAEKKREAKKYRTYCKVTRHRMPDTYDEVLDSAQLALLQTLRNHLMHYAIFASPERRIYLFWKFSPDELTLPSDLLDDNVIATRFVRKAEQIVCATLVESPFLFPKLILPLADQQLDMPSR